MLFKGKVAIVSGVGTGLGGETALLLAREGADVVLGARTLTKLEDYARQIEAMGRRVLVVPTDVTKEEDARNVADKAIGHFAKIDVLIHNAGCTGAYEPLVETPVPAFWTSVYYMSSSKSVFRRPQHEKIPFYHGDRFIE